MADLANPVQVLPTAWERALWLSQRRYEALVRTASALSAAGATAVLALALRPGGFTNVLAAVTVGLAAGAWAGVARANTRPRRVLREAYAAWLLTQTMVESGQEAARAFGHAATSLKARGWLDIDREAYRKALRESAGEGAALLDATVLDPLQTSLAAIATVADETVRTHRERSDAWLKTQLDALQQDTTESLDRATRMAAEAKVLEASAEARLARARALGVRAAEVMVYSEGGQIPSSSIGIEAQGLRDQVDEATREAVRGRVYESHAAGVILGSPTRWSAHATPFQLTQELMELFDPTVAVVPPGQK